MKGLEKDKLLAVVLLLSLLVLEATARSFRKTREGTYPQSSPFHDIPLNPGSSSDVVDDDYKSGTGDVWRENRMHKLVNVFENEFSVDDQQEDSHQHTPEDGAEEEESSGLSAEEQEMIKKRILDGLGLTTIPTRNLSNIPEEEIELAYREYAKAVEEEQKRYEAQIEDEDDEKETWEDQEPDQKSISSFRFYSNKTPRSMHGRGRRSTDGGEQLVHFSVSLPAAMNNSRLLEATARFWKKGSYPRRSSNTSADEGTYNTSSKVAVSFYRLDNIPRGRSRFAKLDPIFMSTQNVSIFGHEWIEVDMTAAVRHWVGSSPPDTGVLIRCPDCEAVGVRFMTGGRRRGLTGGGGKIPRLDVRTEVMGVRRVKRSRKMRKSMRRRLHPHADCHDATHPRGKRSSRCCRRSMKVRFADLQRFDFILDPKEFDAYYCSGRCPARYNPANEHALLQSLLNLRGKDNVPGPCCAPTKLKGLNILHVGDDGRIRTTFWSDVIVTECGCA